MSRVKSNYKSIIELVSMTFLFAICLVGLFQFFNPTDILFRAPKDISQNESAYIDAIGNIAIGFAGAWVAVKIAGIATNLQQQDSDSKFKETYQKEAHRVSLLNSNLTRDVLEAKRSCTSFIVFLLENPKLTMSKGKREIYNTNENVTTEEVNKLLLNFYVRLENDILKLINSIEELVMDKTYMSILLDNMTGHSPPSHKYELEQYFTLKDEAERREMIEYYSNIIIKDTERFGFYSEYMVNQSNFGDGLHYIRSNSLIDERKIYIKKLLQAERNGVIKVSEAAWLLLGSLLVGTQTPEDKKEARTSNTGFFFIALMLGSEIDDDLFKRYLKKKDVDDELADEVSKSIFFIHGEDAGPPKTEASPMLTELSDLIQKSIELHSLFLIPGENKGNSSISSLGMPLNQENKDKSSNIEDKSDKSVNKPINQ